MGCAAFMVVLRRKGTGMRVLFGKLLSGCACAQLAREFTNSRDLDERLFRLYQVVLHATVPSAAPLGLRKPIATAGGDVSRFPPRFDRIFSGETLTPVFGDLDAGIFAVFT